MSLLGEKQWRKEQLACECVKVKELVRANVFKNGGGGGAAGGGVGGDLFEGD